MLARISYIPHILQSSKYDPSIAPSQSILPSRKDSLRQGNIADLDIFVGPLVEQLDAANLRGDLLGKNLVSGDGFDFDFLVVRHDGGD